MTEAMLPDGPLKLTPAQLQQFEDDGFFLIEEALTPGEIDELLEVADELIEAARGYWINDSFWLNPLAKLFDKGTRRELVVQPDGSDGLLVSYTEGGNTPGDAYLWLVGPTGLPRAWKMWVSIIPVGGLEASWEEWIELETGAKVSLRHRWSRFTLELKDIEGATSLEELTAENDPLAAIASARN